MTGEQMTGPATSLADQIASYLAGLSDDRIPDAVTEAAKLGIADSVAVITAGSASALTKPMRRYLDGAGASGSVPILGRFARTSPELAALANGAFSHAHIFDDVLSVMPGHPSGTLLAAILSAAAGRDASGRRVITAFVAGMQVAGTFGKAIGFGHYDRGYHATSTLGLFGALAGIAVVRGYDRETVINAFGIAASAAAGLQANFGSMTSPLHSGWAARSAVTAAALAEAGVTASGTALEAFFSAYGTPDSDPAAVRPMLESWVLLDPGLSLKKYPGAYATHRAVEGVRDLRRQTPFTAAEVSRVDCAFPIGGLKPLKFSRPANSFEACFSLEYAVGTEILDGCHTIALYSDDAVARPGIAAAMERVAAYETEECSRINPAGSTSIRGEVRVTVTLADGRTLATVVRTPPGHPSKPLSWAELESKFVQCCAHAGIGPESRACFLELRELEQCAALDSALSPLTAAP